MTQIDSNTTLCFRGFFGACPESCLGILSDMQTAVPLEYRIGNPNPIYFLMTMNWLSTYKKESELAGLFKLDEKTVRKWIWIYVRAIQALKAIKVM